MSNRHLLAVIVLVLVHGATADILDIKSPQNPALDSLAKGLRKHGIDVARNLNATDSLSHKIAKPRLGRLADLSSYSPPTSKELLNWEQAYAEDRIGGIAFIYGEEPNKESTQNYAQFLHLWYQAETEDRIFISFAGHDYPAARFTALVVEKQGLSNWLLAASAGDPQAVERAGKVYVTAGQRWTIDSTQARRYESVITEFALLGRALIDGGDSVIALNDRQKRKAARQEPTRFLKASLGDEFEESVIPEIVVVGGIALGETAVISLALKEIVFDEQQHLLGIDENGAIWKFPEADAKVLKACFDFAFRSEEIHSDAIVDIDAKGKVKISSAFRNTDVGYELMEMDTEPFKFVDNLSARKSVIIDNEVSITAQDDGGLHFFASYDIRFIAADRMRIAQTQVALEYHYDSSARSSSFVDSWGPRVKRLRGDLQYEKLGNNTANVGEYAAWSGLFRKVKQQALRFDQGRYEFMKIDKSGRITPRRY